MVVIVAVAAVVIVVVSIPAVVVAVVAVSLVAVATVAVQGAPHRINQSHPMIPSYAPCSYG